MRFEGSRRKTGKKAGQTPEESKIEERRSKIKNLIGGIALDTEDSLSYCPMTDDF
jgi:hypothetical protein